MRTLDKRRLKQLKQGQIIPSYATFCKLLKEPVYTNTQARKQQLDLWSRFITFEKIENSNKYIITEPYIQQKNVVETPDILRTPKEFRDSLLDEEQVISKIGRTRKRLIINFMIYNMLRLINQTGSEFVMFHWPTSELYTTKTQKRRYHELIRSMYQIASYLHVLEIHHYRFTENLFSHEFAPLSVEEEKKLMHIKHIASKREHAEKIISEMYAEVYTEPEEFIIYNEEDVIEYITAILRRPTSFDYTYFTTKYQLTKYMKNLTAQQEKIIEEFTKGSFYGIDSVDCIHTENYEHLDKPQGYEEYMKLMPLVINRFILHGCL